MCCVSRFSEGRRLDTHTTQATQPKQTTMHRAVAYNEMGMQFGYHEARRQLSKSVHQLTLAVRLDPGAGIYLANLAMAYHHLGFLREAAHFSRQGVCV